MNVQKQTDFHVTGDPNAEDTVLLQLVEKRDQNAMKEIFDRYSGKVFSVGWHFLRDEGHAEDVMQEVFFKV